MAPDDARRVARITLGGMAQTVEAVRDVRATPLDRWWRDIRHACRALRAAPAFTIVALAVSTLSIGASTAIFSVVDGVLLRPLPFAAADRLVAVSELDLRRPSDNDRRGVAPQNFIDWHARQRAFTGLAAIADWDVSLKAEPGQEPETLTAQAVTTDFFSVLGSAPLIGRTFSAGHEVEGARVAVISHRLWQRAFAGASAAVGRSMTINRRQYHVVGIMPPDFLYPRAEDLLAGEVEGDGTDIWLG
jgi:hypothetical protein